VVACAALMSALFAAAERGALERGVVPATAFVEGFGHAFGAVAVALALLLALSLAKGGVWWAR